MASIPIHNETDYPLTDDMTQYIMPDTQEHFGEEVRGIRVQAGIERHAFNARTREVRYAFSPQDFGFGPTCRAPEPHTLRDTSITATTSAARCGDRRRERPSIMGGQ